MVNKHLKKLFPPTFTNVTLDICTFDNEPILDPENPEYKPITATIAGPNNKSVTGKYNGKATRFTHRKTFLSTICCKQLTVYRIDDVGKFEAENDGNKITYEGNFFNNKFNHGNDMDIEATLVFDNHYIYKGCFENGLKHGPGA